MAETEPPLSDSYAKITDYTDTCPNGENWCDGPYGDELPCFDCFVPSHDYGTKGDDDAGE